MIAGNSSMIIQYIAEKGTISKKAYDDRQWKIILRSEINLNGELLTPFPSDPDVFYMQNVRLHIHIWFIYVKLYVTFRICYIYA